MQEVQFFGPRVYVGATARILKDDSGNAVFDSNGNGRVDPSDSAVLTQISIEGCLGQVCTPYDKLRAHVGSLGHASATEVAESMTKYEYAGTTAQVVNLVPQHQLEPAAAEHFGTVFHFDAEQPYAEFIFREK